MPGKTTATIEKEIGVVDEQIGKKMRKLDLDHDGVLSTAELEEAVKNVLLGPKGKGGRTAAEIQEFLFQLDEWRRKVIF